MQEDFKYVDITRKIIGCAMNVHSYLGPGFYESIYQRCLVIELLESGLDCKSEVVKDIYYRGQFVGKRRLDILVEDKVLVELKAISVIDNCCFNKILNYLKVFKIDVGLLLNFGTPSLSYKRFANSKSSAKSNHP
jgi:GxxExxY protein